MFSLVCVLEAQDVAFQTDTYNGIQTGRYTQAVNGISQYFSWVVFPFSSVVWKVLYKHSNCQLQIWIFCLLLETQLWRNK